MSIAKKLAKSLLDGESVKNFIKRNNPRKHGKWTQLTGHPGFPIDNEGDTNWKAAPTTLTGRFQLIDEIYDEYGICLIVKDRFGKLWSVVGSGYNRLKL